MSIIFRSAKVFLFTVFLFGFSTGGGSLSSTLSNESAVQDLLTNYDKSIFVSIQNQRLYLIYKKKIVKQFSISTSKYGVGFESGSQKTPSGLHFIERKIGEGVPLHGIFNYRKFSGKLSVPDHPKFVEQDLITTRILWLDGADWENRQSFKRCIYIHGTPEESKIGEPSSHGCIRMRNIDIYALYEFVDQGTPVYIN